MHTHSRLSKAIVILCLAATSRFCFAVETHIWNQSDQASFARGTPKNLSIRSDGRLILAPTLKELDSTGVPYLWAITRDANGTVYYAGGAPTGATTTVYALTPGGKGKAVANLPGLEVHALAVDQENRVYAAVLPDAKIYRIENGKAQLFFDPKCKYIWAMVFDHQGNLYVATGDNGTIYKVSPDGKGTSFFHTEETNVRSMIINSAGNLIVGTEPGGLIFRITPQGESFVLYQTDKREITALAEHDSVTYAAAVGGNKTSAVSVTGAAPVLPLNRPAIQATGAPKIGQTPPTLAPPVGTLRASVTGGSDLYRIDKEGFAEKIWTSATDLIYSIAFSPDGRPLVGTGNKGIVYRIDSPQLFTQLLDLPSSQVTVLVPGQNGILYAATGNVGSLYSIGPSTEHSGTLESDVFDSSDFSYWGKVHVTSNLETNALKLETRSGNVNRPQSNWSAWQPVSVSKLGGQIQSPPARFLQYRLTMTSNAARESSDESSPGVTAIDVAYLPKNLAPHVDQIDIAPINYREAAANSFLERSVTPSGSPTALTLPAVGQQRSALSSANLEGNSAATLQYRKSYITLRWKAEDPNEDELSFKVELREKNNKLWRVLKDNLQEHFYSFDSSAFPDGEYIARIIATDAPSNTPADALTASLQSDSFKVDNTPPVISNVASTSEAGRRKISFTATDALNLLDKAEYSINGGDWTLLNPVNRVSDSQSLNYTIEADPNAIVAVRIFDDDDNVVVKQF